MKYKHIILTRFNLQFELGNDIYIQPSWLDERFRLFERYCLPSIVGQTNQNFTWVILSSEQTPTKYKERLSQYAQTYSNIKLEYCPYYDDVNILYKEIGEKHIADNNFLLSTRIDNDDMLSLDFVQTLQSHVKYISDKAIITFPNGIQWFERESITCGISYPPNHFLNFLEPRQEIRTCLGVDHTKVNPRKLIQLKQDSMWCEIVHGNNICNGYVPKYRYSLNPQKLFSFPVKITKSNPIDQCKFLLREHLRFRYRQIYRNLQKIIGCHTS